MLIQSGEAYCSYQQVLVVLQAQMAADVEELRSQIRLEIMQEIVEDPEFS